MSTHKVYEVHPDGSKKLKGIFHSEGHENKQGQSDGHKNPEREAKRFADSYKGQIATKIEVTK